jgi:predicted nuclease with RNAse H fold
MNTLGIDLAAQPKNTAACLIDWGSGSAEVETLATGLTDDDLLASAGGCDKVGIDSPFGWPDEFVDALAAHHRGEAPWPGRHQTSPAEQDAFRRRLRFRATDRFCHELGLRPLSVSTDRIGVTAMRCAQLLARLEDAGKPVIRDGSGLAVEVYPAGALERWGLPSAGYKRRAGRDALRPLAAALLARLPELRLAPDHRAACETSDHCLDALVCSLVARGTALGLTIEPRTDEERKRARREGWIHLPAERSLAKLLVR